MESLSFSQPPTLSWHNLEWWFVKKKPNWVSTHFWPSRNHARSPITNPSWVDLSSQADCFLMEGVLVTNWLDLCFCNNANYIRQVHLKEWPVEWQVLSKFSFQYCNKSLVEATFVISAICPKIQLFAKKFTASLLKASCFFLHHMEALVGNLAQTIEKIICLTCFFSPSYI